MLEKGKRVRLAIRETTMSLLGTFQYFGEHGVFIRGEIGQEIFVPYLALLWLEEIL